MEDTAETPYGKVASGDWKPPFDDATKQERFKVDTIAMLSRLPDERIVKLYWDRRFSFTDADTVDAIYKEAIKRGIL